VNEDKKLVSNEQCVFALKGIGGLLYAIGSHEHASGELTKADLTNVGIAIDVITDHIAANEGIC